ncbi:MAG: hypothetical protein QG618_1556 [Thermodesulfobacteriota bacterium]|nr:hypothetical protein [Thermodesulfobacteriota bacterium]
MKWHPITSLGIEVTKHGGNGQVFVRSLRTGKDLSVRNGFVQLYNPDTKHRKSYSAHRLWAHTQGFPYKQVEPVSISDSLLPSESADVFDEAQAMLRKCISYLKKLLAPESLPFIKPHTVLQITKFLASYMKKDEESSSSMPDIDEETKEMYRHALDDYYVEHPLKR